VPREAAVSKREVSFYNFVLWFSAKNGIVFYDVIPPGVEPVALPYLLAGVGYGAIAA